jgi:hypothetical protein
MLMEPGKEPLCLLRIPPTSPRRRVSHDANDYRMKQTKKAGPYMRTRDWAFQDLDKGEWRIPTP